MSTKDATKQAARTDPGLGPTRAAQSSSPSGVDQAPPSGEDTVETTEKLSEDSMNEGNKLSRADAARMLENIRPTTAEVLKHKTTETRGENYARYDGLGAPAKAKRDDTLEVPLVIADDTQVDGFKLTPEKIRQLERHQREQEERHDTTVPGLREKPESAESSERPRVWKALVAALLVGVLALIVWAFVRPPHTDVPPIEPATAVVVSQAPASTSATASTPSASAVNSTAVPSAAIFVAPSSSSSSNRPIASTSPTHPRTTSTSVTSSPSHSAASSLPVAAPSATNDPNMSLVHSTLHNSQSPPPSP